MNKKRDFMQNKDSENIYSQLEIQRLNFYTEKSQDMMHETVKRLCQLRNKLVEKEKFEYVIENMSNGLIVLDKNFHITTINKKAKELLMINEYKYDFNLIKHLDDNYKMARQISSENFFNKNFVFDLERSETKQFPPLFLSVHSSPIFNADKEVNNIVLVIENITHDKIEIKLKQDFLGLISHKLRTPITVMTGQLEIVLEGLLGDLTEKQKDTLGKVNNNVFKLYNLIDKLIGFTTIDSGFMNEKDIAVDLNHVMEMMLKYIKPFKTDENTKVSYDFPKNTTVFMSDTAAHLVFNNLIENAIKFSDKKITEINIVGKLIKQNRMEITVTDNGAGIPPEFYAKIFDIFFQIEKDFTGNVEGAGLGLAIVKHIVEKYDGQISLLSELGKGSTFNFTLPTKPL